MSDVSRYANYEPTQYQKWFATWLVREVGYKPSQADTAKQAFLDGVALAVAARNTFNESEFLEEMREKYGVKKRGPKRAPASATVEPDDDDDDDDDFDEEPQPRKRAAKKAAPAKRRRAAEPEADDDYDDLDDDDDDDDFDDDADDVEETPAPKRRGRPAKAAQPAKRTTRATPKGRGKPQPADDEFAF